MHPTCSHPATGSSATSAAATGSQTWRPLSTSPQLHRTNNTDITALRLISILIRSLSAQEMTTPATQASKAKAPPHPTPLFRQANMGMQTCTHADTCTCPLSQALSEWGRYTNPPMPPKRETLTASYTEKDRADTHPHSFYCQESIFSYDSFSPFDPHK